MTMDEAGALAPFSQVFRLDFNAVIAAQSLPRLDADAGGRQQALRDLWTAFEIYKATILTRDVQGDARADIPSAKREESWRYYESTADLFRALNRGGSLSGLIAGGREAVDARIDSFMKKHEIRPEDLRARAFAEGFLLLTLHPPLPNNMRTDTIHGDLLHITQNFLKQNTLEDILEALHALRQKRHAPPPRKPAP